ncbi:hypothetical protein ACM66B_005506 [Microbotryomycetes sp. NB124-2]
MTSWTPEQEQVVQALIKKAEKQRASHLPVIAGATLTCAVLPCVLSTPAPLPAAIVRLATLLPLVATSTLLLLDLRRPIEPLDWLAAPAAVAGAAAIALGDKHSIRTWLWALPAVAVLFACDSERSLLKGIEQARKMNQLLYNVPGA